MARTTIVFELALCSPSGLEADRDAVRSAIGEVNRFLVSDSKQVDVLAWDTDVRPSIGSDVQDVVNTQIVDRADVGLVLIGDFLGSPTPRAPSGTVEEVRSFIRRKKAGENVDLMLFFKRLPVRYDRTALERMQAIVEFREEMQAEGVFWREYETPQELAQVVRLHLPNAVRALDGGGPNSAAPSSPPATGFVATPVSSSDDETEEGALDYEIAFAESMEVLGDALTAVGAAAEMSGKVMAEITEEMESAAGQPRSPIALRGFANRLGEALDSYADVLEIEAGRFENSAEVALNSTIAVLGFVGTGDIQTDADELVGLSHAIDGTRLEMISMADSVKSTADTLAEFPKLTKELGRAKRRVAAQSNRLEVAATRMAERLAEASQAAQERAKQIATPSLLPGLGG